MKRLPIRLRSVIPLLAAVAAGPGAAQSVTTVLTHGYSFDGEKGVWIESMGEAILARGGAEGAICRYRQDSGAWQLVSGTLEHTAPVVLIYRWLDDFDKAGVNDGFAEAAGDALEAAVRDAHFVDGANQPMAGFDLVVDRDLHFISHSRGTCVNSEAVERLAVAGIAVDHVTTFDPHPMNGTLDPPLNFNWGDPTPKRWINVAFADNYWRADGGWANAADFDGIPLTLTHNVELNEQALECCGYQYSHSDTHLWYHGTIDLSPNPCDGEACISDTARQTWWSEQLPAPTSGFFYARLGGGAAERPALPAGEDPGTVEAIFNGTFNNARHAGWLYHGGHLAGTIVSQSGETFLRLNASGSSAAHNRFMLDPGVTHLLVDLNVLTASADDRLMVRLVDAAGTAHQVASMALNGAAGWQRDVALPIGGSIPRGRRYVLDVAIEGGGGIDAVVGLDRFSLDSRPTTDLVALAINVGTLLEGDVDALRVSDDVHVHTRSGFGSTFVDLHNMTAVMRAITTRTSPSTIDLSIETRISHPAGTMQLRLKNWNTGAFVLVGTRGISNVEQTFLIDGVAAASYVQPGTGAIELELKQIVFVPQFAFTFQSWIDLVEIVVR